MVIRDYTYDTQWAKMGSTIEFAEVIKGQGEQEETSHSGTMIQKIPFLQSGDIVMKTNYNNNRVQITQILS